jgi:hypothetical protein
MFETFFIPNLKKSNNNLKKLLLNYQLESLKAIKYATKAYGFLYDTVIISKHCLFYTGDSSKV